VFAALERLGDPVPAWCSVTLRDGRHLADGSTLDEAVAIAERSPAAVAVGVNCSPPDAAIEAVAHLASISSLAVVAYPNRGADWDAVAKAWTGGHDVDMAAVARGLLDAGAHLVGGCCGTGPADVRAIAMEAVSRPSRS
jgi:homocysteine S-methyltransferase